MPVKQIFPPVKKNEKSGREKRQILVKKCRENHFLPLKKSKNRPKMAFTGTKLFIFTGKKILNMHMAQLRVVQIIYLTIAYLKK